MLFPPLRAIRRFTSVRERATHVRAMPPPPPRARSAPSTQREITEFRDILRNRLNRILVLDGNQEEVADIRANELFAEFLSGGMKVSELAQGLEVGREIELRRFREFLKLNDKSGDGGWGRIFELEFDGLENFLKRGP